MDPSLAKRAASSRSAEAILLCALLTACGPEGETSGAGDAASAVAEPALSASASASVSASAVSAPLEPSAPRLPEEDLYPKTLAEQRAALLRRMTVMLRLEPGQLDELRALLDKAPFAGQGNPDLQQYALTRRECRERREQAKVVEQEDPLCGSPFMSPLWDPEAGQTAAQAKVCIDRFEFPNMPCDYPVTWAMAREAALMCKAVGKRLCDAHEWEGACAGALREPEAEYDFKLPRGDMRHRHNAKREIVWAYGKERSFEKCAMDSVKSKTCLPDGWKNCGSNTYPAGSFPECKSAFGVYDQHGNAAEHMNLPLKPEQLGSRGGSGGTEMKGSWFIFKKYDAHPDDCRWRAPDWHGTKLMAHDSHLNYHLGFRCCRDVR